LLELTSPLRQNLLRGQTKQGNPDVQSANAALLGAPGQARISTLGKMLIAQKGIKAD
jgi:hypothetical protein